MLSITVGIACAVPRLELFMELVGAICLSTLGIFLPAVVETVWRWGKDVGPTHWVLWKNVLICIFAVVAMVSGVAYAIIDIFEKL